MYYPAVGIVRGFTRRSHYSCPVTCDEFGVRSTPHSSHTFLQGEWGNKNSDQSCPDVVLFSCFEIHVFILRTRHQAYQSLYTTRSSVHQEQWRTLIRLLAMGAPPSYWCGGSWPPQLCKVRMVWPLWKRIVDNHNVNCTNATVIERWLNAVASPLLESQSRPLASGPCWESLAEDTGLFK